MWPRSSSQSDQSSVETSTVIRSLLTRIYASGPLNANAAALFWYMWDKGGQLDWGEFEGDSAAKPGLARAFSLRYADSTYLALSLEFGALNLEKLGVGAPVDIPAGTHRQCAMNHYIGNSVGCCNQCRRVLLKPPNEDIPNNVDRVNMQHNPKFNRKLNTKPFQKCWKISSSAHSIEDCETQDDTFPMPTGVTPTLDPTGVTPTLDPTFLNNRKTNTASLEYGMEAFNNGVTVLRLEPRSTWDYKNKYVTRLKELRDQFLISQTEAEFLCESLTEWQVLRLPHSDTPYAP